MYEDRPPPCEERKSFAALVRAKKRESDRAVNEESLNRGMGVYLTAYALVLIFLTNIEVFRKNLELSTCFPKLGGHRF